MENFRNHFKLTALTSFLCIFLSFQSANATDFYWIGGSGNWSDLTHWATTSGGAINPIIVPTPLDDVYFDANSGLAGGTVTVNFEAFCNTFNVDPLLGAGVTFQFNAGLITSDVVNVNPNDLLTWNQANTFECLNDVNFSNVNFTMASGFFNITQGNLVLTNNAYFKKQGWVDNCFIDNGTILIDPGTTYEQVDGYFTAGDGDVHIPAGATFSNNAHNKILKEGSFIVDAGATATVNRQWQIYDGGYDVDPGATYTKSGGHLYFYSEHTSTTPYYIQNAGVEMHRLQFQGNHGVEYRLKGDIKATGDGFWIYGNQFISDGYDIEAVYFYNNQNNVNIDLSGTATLTMRYQFRVSTSATTTYAAPDVIKWVNTNHFYFYGGNKVHNDLVFEPANTGSTLIQIQQPGTVNDVTVNANGQQYLEMYHDGVYNNFTFNYNNAAIAVSNPRLRIYNNNTFNGTFQTNSVANNIRPILEMRGNNTFNVLDLNNLQEWVMNSGTTQTTTDLQPIDGICGEVVVIHSASLGAQANLSQTSSTVDMDWLVLQDMKATGGATFNATNTIDAGNNTGWNIVPVPAATFYWIGGNGNWDDSAHWSLSSGGVSNGCAIPSRIDDVVFDANSFTGGGQYCNVNINTAECKSMTWSGSASGSGISNNKTLNIYGNLECDANMNWAYSGQLHFQNATMATIKTNGVTINAPIYLDGQSQTTANWQLLDDLKSNQWVYLYYGAFKSNGNNLDVYSFYDQAVSAVSADFTGSTLIKLNNQWRMWTNSTLIMPATCEIVFDAVNHMYFNSNGQNNTNRKTYGNVTFNSNGTGGYEIQMRGNYNNYNDVTVNHGGTYRFYNDGNFMTFNNLIVNYTKPVSTSTNNFVQIYSQNMDVVNDFKVTGTVQNNPRVQMPYNTTYNNAVFTNCYSWANWTGNTRTFTNLEVTSDCNAKTLIYSQQPGSQANISVSGTATCNNCVLQDINAIGGGTFTSTNSAIAANVTGWSAGTGGNYYWVGGTGSWNDPAHWSLTPGGPSAGCIPTRVDNVFFDVNSFTAPNQTVTIPNLSECKSMVWNNVNNPIVNGGDNFYIFGSLILDPNVTWNHGNWVYFQSREPGNIIKTNGVPLRYVQFLGEGTYLGEWTLQSDFKATHHIYFRSGKFVSNGYAVEGMRLYNDYNDSRITLDFTGTPEIRAHSYVLFYPNPTILASNTDLRFLEQQENIFQLQNFGKTLKNVFVDYGNSTGSTRIYNYNSGIINNVTINSTAWPSIYFYNGGTYNDISIAYDNPSINIPRVEFQSTTTVNNLSVTSTGNGGPHLYLLQNNTFNNLTAAGLGTRLYIGANRTQTVNGLLALGNGSFPVIFQSTTSGTQGTIYKPTGTVCLDFVVMKDIKASTMATGGATFYAGASSVNIANNTNWIFNSCGAYYWVGDNGNWSDYASHWATSSGGSGFHSSVPGPDDDVFFDANSFTTANRVVTVDVPVAYSHDMKWISASFTPTFVGSGTIEVHGDLELITGMNQDYTGLWEFKAPDNGHFINSAGQTLANVTFTGGATGQGEWTLSNPLNVAENLNFDNGTLKTNNRSISTANFYSSTGNTRSLQLGSSIVTVNGGVWDPETLSDSDLDEGTSTIVITGDNTSTTSAFNGYDLTYNDVTFTTSSTLSSLMTGNNVFNTLQVDPGMTLNVEVATTNTMSDFIANASCANLITIRSTVAGTQANFTKSSGIVDASFLSLTDMNATGGATWNANYSYDNDEPTDGLDNNTGWNFTPPLDIVIVTDNTYVDCTLNNNGTATVSSITGGIAPYTYLWSTTETTASIENLIPGTYTVTITDAVGCQVIETIEVENTPSPITPEPFTLSAEQVCLGTAINFTAGTTTPAATSYLWKFGDFTTSTDQNPTKTYAAGGTYTVSLSYFDLEGCPATITEEVTVSDPTQVIDKANVSCFGEGDGSITITASGGIAPYEFSIDNGANWQSGNVFSGLTPATYQVKTRDALSCVTATNAQTVTQPTAALSQSVSSVNATCDDGSITITASGGTMPYRYSINGGITFVPANVLEPLAAGTYNVVTRDANLCLTSAQEIVITSSGPEINVQGNTEDILDGSSVPQLSNHTDFGTVSISSSMIRTYTIQNIGTSNLTISNIAVSGSQFTFGTLTPTGPITPGNSATFTVYFSPTSAGLQMGAVTITNSDCNEEQYDFIVEGTGIECTDPLFTECPSDQNVNTTTGTCSAAAFYTATVSGTPAPDVSYVFTGATTGSGDGTGSGATFGIGETEVTISATNSCGTENCTFTVTVTDNEAPAITCPTPDASYSADSGLCSASLTFAAASSDNCGVATTEYSVDGTAISFPYAFPVGTTTVDVLVTDTNDNDNNCSFDVVVTDDEAPVIADCPLKIDQDNDAGVCGAVVSWTEPTASDNCTDAIDLVWTKSHAPGDTFPVGTTTVTYTATDMASNESMTCSFDVTVTNILPYGFSTIVPSSLDPIQAGTEFILSADFNDDNLTSATWYFSDDGEINDPLDAELSFSGDISGGIVSGTFNFPAGDTGVYTVKVVVVDACDETAEATYDYVVIYDPTGGFVTGGGWFDSPEGALVGTTTTGKANFGFVAKYRRGNNNSHEVDGNTNFQFKEGDFHFKSSSHDDMSLVISGERKATYRGSGTVNGAGYYGFMVTVVDGEAPGAGQGDMDTFRIKVWTGGAPSDVVYDNELGNAENADASTGLGGGSIVIHRPRGNGSRLLEEPIENSNLFEVKSWPNPSSTNFNISITTDNRLDTVDIQVFDISNKQVHVDKFNWNDEYKFGEKLQSGIYFVRISQGEKHQMLRVMKY